ncbi:MAG TPA: CAP domain-containing protein [Rhizomicrobium sp.]|jgi:hypothetical protein
MKIAVSVLAALLLSVPAQAEGDFAMRILAAHNSERAALNIPPLRWDEGLAANAAVWAKHLADTGTFEHADATTRSEEGENLWEGTAGGYSLEQMVAMWAAEKRYFSAGTFKGSVVDGHPIGHYTQMIWRNTTSIGCALATARGTDVLVCRYSPMGNFLGEAVY